MLACYALIEMNRKLNHALASLVLIYSATAWSQETTMATIKGEDGYTLSGETECGGKATSTIKPGERFIARELSYTIKDLEVYPPPGERQALEWLGTGMCTSGRESPALFLVIRFVSCPMSR